MRRLAILVLASISFSAGAGCNVALPEWSLPRWERDYHAAEERAQSRARPMLVYYKRAAQWRADPILDALNSPEVRQRTKKYVRCVLTPDYEPDRRFVGQYDVERAPAIILIHRDGTYHTMQGRTGVDEIIPFLEGATAPGSQPKSDPYLARPIDYHWEYMLADAEAMAVKRKVPLLIVLDRPFTTDWSHLNPMFNRREVFRRCSEMVLVRPAPMFGGAEDARDRFGVKKLPAVVVLYPTGEFDVLELPGSFEALVRFLDDSISRSTKTVDSRSSS